MIITQEENILSEIRKIKQVLQSKPTIEGKGVRLKRAFGFNEVPLLDPFLMLDHFGSTNPADYLARFPWTLIEEPRSSPI